MECNVLNSVVDWGTVDPKVEGSVVCLRFATFAIQLLFCCFCAPLP